MEQELQRIKAEALDAIKDAADQQALQDIRVKYLGKKGEVTALLKGLGKLSPEELQSYSNLALLLDLLQRYTPFS